MDHLKTVIFRFLIEYPTSHYNVVIQFLILPFLGCIQFNFFQENCPKNGLTSDTNTGIQLKFQEDEQSIQDAQNNDADTVIHPSSVFKMNKESEFRERVHRQTTID